VDSLLLHIAIGLATWRLSTLLISERGMFGIFEFIRKVLGENKITYDEMSQASYPNELIQMLQCFFCTSVTIGFILAMVQYRQLSYFEMFIYGLSYSAFSIYFDKQLRRMR
jgi:hypothetical protein